mmetsp:Transcript_88284/g.274288  ORF Transcript_88284/g.274288 Transcript_88284/m.274288 type:complete len:649 (-) Transcript_88284:156-2102(-)
MTRDPPRHGPACERKQAPPGAPRSGDTPQAARAPAAAGKQVDGPAAARNAAAKQMPKASPSPVMPSDFGQPTQQYQVMTEWAYVRQDPVLHSAVHGKKARGELVLAGEETFDGWVHLVTEPGWIVKDMQGRHGVGEVLSPVGSKQLLAVPRPCAEPGPLEFEVVFKPHVAVRSGPSKEAQIVGVKKHRETAMADVQTYGGWVRLQGGGGWMLSEDTSFGKLLSCHELEARAQVDARALAFKAMEEAVAHNSVDLLRKALASARSAGVDKLQTQHAEKALATLLEQSAKRDAQVREFRQRVEKNKDNERELRDCIDDGAKADLREETKLAQRYLDELLDARSKTQQKHSGLLERLAAAAASGDRAEMKAARDAAKKGGVDMKEIARIFSLNVINAGQGAKAADASAPPASQEQPAAAAAAPAPEPAGGPTEPSATSLELALGVQVQLQHLQARPRLNGAIGVVVAHRQAGWQVLLLHGGTGMKLLKEGNLAPYNGPRERASAVFPSETGQEQAAERMEELPPDAQAAAVPESGADGAWVCGECDFSNPKPGWVCEACDEPRQGVAPQQAAQTSIFSGRWVGASGEWMGTVQGTLLQWADGPEVELAVLSERSFSCEMSAEGVTETFSAELDAEGRLVWCDGDIWTLSDL